MKLASPVPLWLLVTQSRLCSGEWKRDVRIARGSSLLSQPQFGASHLPALREPCCRGTPWGAMGSLGRVFPFRICRDRAQPGGAHAGQPHHGPRDSGTARLTPSTPGLPSSPGTSTWCPRHVPEHSASWAGNPETLWTWLRPSFERLG